MIHAEPRNTLMRKTPYKSVQMVRRIALTVTLAIVLSGCIDRQVSLNKTASDGTTQIAHCDAKAFGLAMVIMEQQDFNDCRKHYRENGYSE